MKSKRLIGLVLLIIGIVLICFGLYGKSRQTGARSDVSHVTSPFGKNKATDTFGDIAEGKISEYDKPIFWCFAGGIALVVIGGGMVICCRCHNKRR